MGELRCELIYVATQLLRRFEIQIAYPEKPWKTTYATVHVQSDMWLRISKREPSI